MSLFGQPCKPATMFPPTPVAQPTPYIPDIQSHPFQFIQSCLDPMSPHSPFRHFFYNRLPPNTAAIEPAALPKPSQISDRLWAQTWEDIPKAGRFVPVLAQSFEDLQARARWQDEQMAAHSLKASEVSAKCRELLDSFTAVGADTRVGKLFGVLEKQAALASKVIHVMRQVEVIRRSGRRLSENECGMGKLLRLLLKQLQQPPVDLNCLRVYAYQVEALKQQHGTHLPLVLSGEAVGKAILILQEQQRALQELVKTVADALVDYDIISRGYES